MYCSLFSPFVPQKSSISLRPAISVRPPREHRIQEGKVVFPLGVSVQGDVVVSIYHMRSTIGGRLQAKVHFKNCTVPNPSDSFLQSLCNGKVDISISQSPAGSH